MLRAAFELTGDIAKSWELMERTCSDLFPHHPHPVHYVEDINDGRHGHDSILMVLDDYLAGHR